MREEDEVKRNGERDREKLSGHAERNRRRDTTFSGMLRGGRSAVERARRDGT